MLPPDTSEVMTINIKLDWTEVWWVPLEAEIGGFLSIRPALSPQSWLTSLSPTGLQLRFSSGSAAKASQLTTQKSKNSQHSVESALLNSSLYFNAS